jgi:hypothetical protein
VSLYIPHGVLIVPLNTCTFGDRNRPPAFVTSVGQALFKQRSRFT